MKKALIGDTFYKRDEPVPAVDGFEAPKPMVFAGMYPTDQSLLPTMRKAIQKLCLNDASVDVNSDNSAALGQVNALSQKFLFELCCDICYDF